MYSNIFRRSSVLFCSQLCLKVPHFRFQGDDDDWNYHCKKCGFFRDFGPDGDHPMMRIWKCAACESLMCARCINAKEKFTMHSYMSAADPSKHVDLGFVCEPCFDTPKGLAYRKSHDC